MTARGFVSWKTARRVALALLVLAAVAALREGVPVSCKDAVAEAKVVRLCEPAALTDLPVALFAFVASLLLLGEVTELGIAGVVTLKRDVAAAKASVEEVRREVGDLRLTMASVAQAGASARSETNVYVGGRAAATATAVEAAQDPMLDPLVERAAENETGAIASAALVAGFTGLVRLMPDWAGDVGLVGFAYGGDGALEPHVWWHADTGEISAAAALLDDPLTSVVIDMAGPRWTVVAPAAGDAGEPLGALAVLVEPAAAGRGSDVDGETAIEDLAAAVDLAAKVYARLRLDLVGGGPDGDRQRGRDGAP